MNRPGTTKGSVTRAREDSPSWERTIGTTVYIPNSATAKAARTRAADRSCQANSSSYCCRHNGTRQAGASCDQGEPRLA